MQAKEWIQIINELLSIGCKEFVLTGGEVMISKNFYPVYEHLKANSCKVHVFTNGSILKQKHIQLFSKLIPDSISITKYGKTNAEYEAITGRGGSILEQIEQNILKLRSLNLNVNLGTILCKGLELNSDSGESPALEPIEMNTYMIPALHSNENLAQRLDPKKIIAIEKNNPSRDRANREFYTNITPILSDSAEYEKKCPGGHSSVFISAAGMMSMCAIYRKESYNTLDKRNTVSDIIKKLGKVHTKLKNIYYNSRCGSCNLNRNCRNCPAYALLETGFPDKNPYLCELALERANEYLADKPTNSNKYGG